MYRIYINGTALIIADFVPAGLKPFQELDVQSFDFKDFYRRVKKGNPENYVIISSDPKRTFKNIRRSYGLIKAAGGLVKNESNEYLFIFRKGKWDLPKGKLDAGEKNRVAAKREVMEECGIKIAEVGNRLARTWHVYEEKGEVVFKKTSWYNMKARKQKLVPQLEEDITDARWISEGDFSKVKDNTYPLIKDLMSLVETAS